VKTWLFPTYAGIERHLRGMAQFHRGGLSTSDVGIDRGAVTWLRMRKTTDGKTASLLNLVE
jgi:hypothetical protein